jgi:phage tail sheath protein FI
VTVTGAPGVTVSQSTTLPPRSVPADTSTWFIAGQTVRGAAAPILVTSLGAFIDKLGDRMATSPLYDAVELFFREGGARCYVSRVTGAASVAAFKNLQDAGAATALVVTANSSGSWGNNLKVAVLAGGVGGTYQIQIQYNNVVVEQSGDLLDTAAGVAWGTGSDYVTITQGASVLDPVVAAAAALATGADDPGSITDANYKTALDRFTRDLGTGLVSQPGRTSSQAHLDTLAHAKANNRAAVLDGVDTTIVATLTAQATSDRIGLNGRYGAIFAPWVVIPGIAAGTTRTAPPSGLVAGLVSRNEGLLSPNAPAAGDNGIARYAIGLSQQGWIDSDRALLNNSGIDVIRILRAQVKVYGWRSLADPNTEPDWLNFGNARLFTAIAADANDVADAYVLNQIDGQGLLISQFGGDLTGMLLTYWNEGSLYGVTPDEAFVVDVGNEVNTDDTIAAGELHAVLAVRMSPMSEFVIIEVVKVSITENLS